MAFRPPCLGPEKIVGGGEGGVGWGGVRGAAGKVGEGGGGREGATFTDGRCSNSVQSCSSTCTLRLQSGRWQCDKHRLAATRFVRCLKKPLYHFLQQQKRQKSRSDKINFAD